MNNLYSRLDEKTVHAFANLMIEKMEALTVSWQQPWINVKLRGRPQNLNGRPYFSSNALFLYLLCELRHFETPVFLTFLQAKENGLLISKGAKAFPVIYFDFLVKDILTGEKITFDEYNELPEEQQDAYRVSSFVRQHLVFNVEQTNIKEAKPELWDELLHKYTVDIPLDTEGRVSCPPLDMLIEKQKWICPIYTEKGDEAYFIPDEIHVPLKNQFMEGESFYATLLHEMTHSTGYEGRLNRPIRNIYGSEEYGREELIAELTAALVSTSMGITTMPLEENVAYLKGWCKDIKKEPQYIFSILSEVGKATAMITSVTDKLEMAISLEAEKAAVQKPMKTYSTGIGEQLEFNFTEEAQSLHEELREKILSRNFRNLQEGEFCKVERIFEETGNFSFTSGEIIETIEDVAYIFRRLEDAAVENGFAVLVKDGVPVVLHLGMGDYTSTILNTTAIKVAADRLNPDEIYIVHNHPSGRVIASRQDKKLWTSLRKMVGDKLKPGIIINLRSGHFGLFTEETLPEKEMKENAIQEIPLKLYSFSKQVFRPNYNPEENTFVRHSGDVASLISSQRLGDRKKINTLILNNAHGVVANIFTPFTSVHENNTEEIAKFLISTIAQTGGTSAIIYGDFQIDKVQKELAQKVKEYSDGNFLVYDAIAIKGNFSSYLSASDESLLEEEKTEYQSHRNEIRYNSNHINQFGMEQNGKEVDLSKVNWEVLKTKFGITKEVLEEKGVLSDMMHFRKSNQLLKVMYEGATGTKEFDARLQFRETDEGYTFRFYPVREAPEFDKPYQGYTFSEEDKTILLQTGHLGKVVNIQPYKSPVKEAFISLDPLTNDIVHVDKDKVSLKDTFCKVALTEKQRMDIMNGKAVYIKDMESQAGKKFSAFLQVDANKKSIGIVQGPKVEINIDKVSEINGVKITEEQREKLKKGGFVFLENLQSSEGKTFSAEVSFSHESKTFRYNFPGAEHAISGELKAAIERGEKVLVSGLTSQNGAKYDAFFFKNKETGRIEKEYPVKDTIMGVKLSDEQKTDLQTGRYVWLEGLKRKDGPTFKAPVIWDGKKGKFAFAELKEQQKEDVSSPSQLKEKKQVEMGREENGPKRGRKM